MERTFRLMLPKYDNSGHRIDTDTLGRYAREVADRFQGVTVIPSVLGCWPLPSHPTGLQCEENMVIEVTRFGGDEEVTRESLAADTEWFRDLARRAGEELRQETIFYQRETDTKTELIAGKPGPQVAPALRERDFFKKLID